MNFKKYKIFGLCLGLFVLILLSNNIFSLQIIEPVKKDLSYQNEVDIGFISENESFMISFLNEDENYTQIKNVELDNSTSQIFVENTKNTKESIFTTLKIKNAEKGVHTIRLELLDKKNNKTKKIILKTYVSDDVISSILLPYTREVDFEEKEYRKIPLKIINKSNSQKTIYLTSDLIKYKKNNFIQTYYLQANSVEKIHFKYYAPEIGKNNFNIYIFSKKNNINLESLKDIKRNIDNKNVVVDIKNISINAKKDLKSIYSSKKHNFPLFALNSLPIYFFNNFLRLI